MFFFLSFFNVPLQPRLLVRTDVDNNLKRIHFCEASRDIHRPTVIVEFALVFGVLTSIDILLTIHTGVARSMERLENNRPSLDWVNAFNELFLPLSLLRLNKHFSSSEDKYCSSLVSFEKSRCYSDCDTMNDALWPLFAVL